MHARQQCFASLKGGTRSLFVSGQPRVDNCIDGAVSVAVSSMTRRLCPRLETV
jgi:hypothetical protein